MSKSYVSLERHVCPVCGKEHDTNSLLLDMRLKDSMERHTVTGYSLCPEHKALYDEGYIALVECDESKSGNPGSNLTLEKAYRTGNIAHIRSSAWERVFNTPPPNTPMVFVGIGVIEKLKSFAPKE